VFPPPEWLVYATPAIALFAMLVALASFVVAVATYRRAGARLGVDFEVGTIINKRLKGDAREVPAIVIQVTNRGMASIGINDFLLRPPSLIGLLRIGPHLLFEDFDVERLSGEELPVTLPPNTSMDWAYRIRSAGLGERQATSLPEIYERVRKSKIEVRLGNGRTIKRIRLTYGAMISLGTFEKS
jgi:hypothetical protein